MTGWRVGWLVLPDDLVRPVERLAQNLFISAPYAFQVAADAAFGCHDELQGHRATYAASRDIPHRRAATSRVYVLPAARRRLLYLRRYQRP